MKDAKTFQKFSYGLFVLTARCDERDSGCIINTAIQLSSDPERIAIAVNKANYTHDMIMKSGKFNISFLSEGALMDTFKHFGFQSGREVDKFDENIPVQYKHSENGLAYITTGTNAFMSANIVDHYDYGSHTLFVAEVTEAEILNEEASATYAYYFANIKSGANAKAQDKTKEERHGFVCRICGYFYEGDVLPEDFICPICKHPASDFYRVG